MAPLSHAAAPTLDDLERRGLKIANWSLRSGLIKLEEDSFNSCVLLRPAQTSYLLSAQDLAYSSSGLFLLGEAAAVRNGLELLLQHQRSSGAIPSALHLTHNGNRLLAMLRRSDRDKPSWRPLWNSQQELSIQDINCLVVWAAGRYTQKTGDLIFLKEKYGRLAKAFSPCRSSLPTGLYGQILYWRAMKSMAEMADLMRHSDTSSWEQEAAGEARILERQFWDDSLGYFKKSPEDPQFQTEGNLLAILWDASDKNQSERILQAMSDLGVRTPWGPLPRPPDLVSGPEKELRTELAALLILCLKKLGRAEEAKDLLQTVLDPILQDGVVRDRLDVVCDPSEPACLRSSGLLLEALAFKTATLLH